MLHPLELRIGAGEAVALVGPSGAGKTTLLRVLAGLQPLSAGRSLALGQDHAALRGAQLRRARSRVGLIHQDYALVPNLRASQNVLSGALGQRSLWAGLRDLVWPRRRDLEQAHALLERVGIGDQLFQRTDTLSGGEQQRVAVARALYQDPAALLADEPVASVDPERARDTLELLVSLAAERNLALVASLHDLPLATELFPRLLALREGRIVFDGAPQDLDPEQYRRLYELPEGSRLEPGAAPPTGPRP